MCLSILLFSSQVLSAIVALESFLTHYVTTTHLCLNVLGVFTHVLKSSAIQQRDAATSTILNILVATF